MKKNMVIHKHPLNSAGIVVVELPEDAKILDVAFQGEDLYLWEVHDDARQPKKKALWDFFVALTGYHYDMLGDSSWRHFRTAHTVIDGSPFVVHVFMGGASYD